MSRVTPPSKLRSFLILYFLAMVVFNGAMIWRVHEQILQGYGDFASFYTAGKILQCGQSAQLYNRSVQWRIQQEFASDVGIRKGALPYMRPPFYAALFVPFAYLSYAHAYELWTACNLVVACAIPFILPQRRTFLSLPGESLFCLAFFPLPFDLLRGQDAVLLLLLFALGYRALAKGYESLSGVLLGLGLFKFHLVLPVALVFLLRRKLRLIAAFALTATALLLLSVFIAGWQTVLFYPKYLLALNASPNAAGMTPRSMPNLHGLAAALAGSSAEHLNWLFVLLSVVGVIFAAVVWREDRNPRNLAVGFSLTIVLTLVTGFYSNGYDLVLLILPILLVSSFFLKDTQLDSVTRSAFWLSVSILLLSPLYWILALKWDQFAWAALTLLALAVPLTVAMRSWQTRVASGN